VREVYIASCILPDGGGGGGGGDNFERTMDGKFTTCLMDLTHLPYTYGWTLTVMVVVVQVLWMVRVLMTLYIAVTLR